jgi:hypothetical protein
LIYLSSGILTQQVQNNLFDDMTELSADMQTAVCSACTVALTMIAAALAFFALILDRFLDMWLMN